VRSDPIRPARPALPMALALAVACAAILTACRDQQSFILVTVQARSTTQPITGVTDLVVAVTNGGMTQPVTYSSPAGAPLTIDQVGKTLSVSFDVRRAGDVILDVEARTKTCTIATGHGDAIIKRNGVNTATVLLDPIGCRPFGVDGGDDGGRDGGDARQPSQPDAEITFAGCDPAASTCGANMTCAVDCTSQMGLCVAGGSGPPGALCSQNTDCAPGTQCFNYSGCAVDGGVVGVCLKFCKTDGDCGGGGSLCRGTVPCGATVTSYHTCTFACDPRGAATQGCPAGLRCFVVETMDQVDCGCVDPSRAQQEGQECDHARGLDCGPGLLCNVMGGTQRCRKVCKRSDNGADCSAGQTCTMLSNDQIYGACL